MFSLLHSSKPAKHNVSPKTLVSNIKLSIDYFERHVDEQPLFRPEYEIGKEILEVIGNAEKIEEAKMLDIAIIYNKITKVDHYNGTGWFDFQIKLKEYFNSYCYAVDFEKDTGIMSIEKHEKIT